MLPTDLENYLISCRNQHAPFDVVASSMSQAGWDADMILSAKNWYIGSTESSTPSEPSTKINNTKFFSTPATLDHYPSNRLHPLIWIVLFVALSILTFLILNTF